MAKKPSSNQVVQQQTWLLEQRDIAIKATGVMRVLFEFDFQHLSAESLYYKPTTPWRVLTTKGVWGIWNSADLNSMPVALGSGPADLRRALALRTTTK